MGWAWPTLQAVRQGRAPQPDLRALLVDEGGGLYTVAVENQDYKVVEKPPGAVHNLSKK